MRRLMMFKVRKKRPFFLILLLLVMLFIGIILYLITSSNPFEQANPFLKEVTIGQSVIGDWRYGGSDQIHLHFYDTYQSVVIPVSSDRFAADGEFVALTHHTATTLTFEPVIDSEVLQPITVLLAIFLCITLMLVFLFRIKKTKKRFKTR